MLPINTQVRGYLLLKHASIMNTPQQLTAHQAQTSLQFRLLKFAMDQMQNNTQQNAVFHLHQVQKLIPILILCQSLLQYLSPLLNKTHHLNSLNLIVWTCLRWRVVRREPSGYQSILMKMMTECILELKWLIKCENGLTLTLITDVLKSDLMKKHHLVPL